MRYLLWLCPALLWACNHEEDPAAEPAEAAIDDAGAPDEGAEDAEVEDAEVEADAVEADAGEADAGPDTGPTECQPWELDGDEGCVAYGCDTDDPNEDDDTLDDASFFDGEAQAAVLCADDDDVYAFELEAPCAFSVSLQFSHETGDLDLLVTDEVGERVAVADSSDDGEAVRVPVTEAGLYHLVVYGYEGGSAPYAISVDVEGHDGGDGRCAPFDACSEGYLIDDFGDCFDCDEGFHDGGDGYCVPVDACARGYRDGGDGDCYPLGECSPGFRPALDGGCAELADCPGQRDDGLGECAADCAVGFHLDGAGTCVPLNVCAFGYQPAGDGSCRDLEDCAGDYVANDAGQCVAANTCPEDDGAEPNDDFRGASGVGLGARIDGVLCGPDEDFFTFEVDGACAFQVSLRFHNGEGDLDLELLQDTEDRNEGGELVALSEGVSDEERVRVSEPAAGRYFARIYGFDAASARYLLRVDTEGHDGGDGTCLPFGQCVEGHLPDAQGACRACDGDRHDGGEGVCVPLGECSAGFRDGGAGACVPAGVCERGFHEGGAACLPVGECSAGFHEGGGGACLAEGACAEGYVLDAGDCVCGAGLHPGGAGGCLAVGCDPGFHEGGVGCVDELACSPGFHHQLGGACRETADCPQDEFDDGEGACAEACAEGYLGHEGRCVAQGYCPASELSTPAGCMAPGDCAGDREGPLCLAQGVCDEQVGAADPVRLAIGETVEATVCDGPRRFEVQTLPRCQLVARLRHEVGVQLDLSQVRGIAGVEGADDRQSALPAPMGQRLVIEPAPEGLVTLEVQGYRGSQGDFALDLLGLGACGGGCAPGHEEGGDGRCVPAGSCSPGYHLGGAGCVPFDACSPTFQLRVDGSCVAQAECPGQRDDGAGACADDCADGYEARGAACAPEALCPAGGCAGDCAQGYSADGAGFCQQEAGACGMEEDAVLADAIALADGGVAYAQACGGRDLYSVSVPADCSVLARLRFAHADADLSLSLLDAEGELLQTEDTASDDEIFAADFDEAGDYFFSVEGEGARYHIALWLTCQ